MKIGYARVSTQEQDTALQLDALRQAGCKKIYQEKASGASRKNRPELQSCLDALRPGDVLVIYKIDRIARSLSDLLAILRQLDEKQATIKSITEPIDTTNSMGVFVVQILGAVAQLERSIIRERSIAGQQAARARGRRPGRKRALSSDDEARLVEEYKTGNITQKALSQKYRVSVSVVKRAIYRTTKTKNYLAKSKI